MGKLMFFITNYSNDITMWIVTSFAERQYMRCDTETQLTSANISIKSIVPLE